MLNRIAAKLGQAAGQVADAGGSIVGVRGGTKEPPFTVARRVGEVEIRVYGPRIAADTTVQADEESARTAGFGRLFRYIVGANSGKAKIAMTAPVAQQQGAGDSTIRFFMPTEHNLDTLPVPHDERLRLVKVPAETVAVLRFSGVAGPEAVANRTAELLDALQRAGIETQGAPETWFYDPPWTLPFRRRNEVAVGVAAD